MRDSFWILIGAIVFLIVFLPPYTLVRNKEQQIAEYDKQIAKLKERKMAFEQEKKRLEEDPVYLEKVGREKMGLVRPGEEVVQIVPAENKNR